MLVKAAGRDKELCPIQDPDALNQISSALA